MDREYIIENWNDLYKSYAKLNIDLTISGISSKRSLLNHYLKYGFNENRKLVDDENILINKDINSNIISELQVNNISNIISEIEVNNNSFKLNELMIIEKLE